MMYYSASMNTLDESLMNAVKEGKLLESSRTNIRLLLDGTKSPIAREAVCLLYTSPSPRDCS